MVKCKITKRKVVCKYQYSTGEKWNKAEKLLGIPQKHRKTRAKKTTKKQQKTSKMVETKDFSHK